jgi:hypothetical protein
MAENELCVLLSNFDVNKDKYLIAWRKENPGNQDVEVVSINDAGSKLKEKKPNKLTLMLTNYKTIVKFEEIWGKFENFWSELKKITDSSLQTLHLIFLAQGVEKVLILKMGESFKNLQCETIEFDCKFTMPLSSSWNEKFLKSLGENYGTRVKLGSTTTSVIVRNPDAQIIELCNDDKTQFSLVKIYLITETYPMGIILSNISPNVISGKTLEVYWKKKKLKEFLKLGTFWLENFQSIAGHIICIKLSSPASSDDEKLPPPASSDDETLIQPVIQPASSDKTSIELYILLADTVDEDDCLSTWKKWNFRKQDVEVVSVNNAESKLKEKKPSRLTLMLTKYKTTEQFNRLWQKFEESFKLLTESLQTLHFIFLVEGSKSQRDVIDEFTFRNNDFFKNLEYEIIKFDCKFTQPLQLPSSEFLPSVIENGIGVNLGSTMTSVTVCSPGARIIQIYNDDPTKFNLVQINLITDFYPMAIILDNVNHDVINGKELKVYWNDEKLVTLSPKDYESSGDRGIYMELPQLAFPDTKLSQPPPSDDETLITPALSDDEELPPSASSGKTLILPASSNDKTLITPASSNEKLPPPPASSNDKTLITPASSNEKLPPPPASSNDKTLITPASSNEKLPPPPVSPDCTIFYCCLGEEFDV